jgi:uncharacterized membrane protein YfcA
MLYLAYLLIGLTGVSFGLIGAGGAILIVPILVYLVGIPSEKATGYALPISMMVSGVGSLIGAKQKQINFMRALEFGIPVAVMTFLTRRFLTPQIPEILFGIPKKSALMVGFALILFVASLSMIFGKKFVPPEKPHPAIGLLFGSVVGLLAGVFGIGGGFLIVPLLVLFFGLDMKQAVPTSLTAVFLIVSSGFAAEFLNHSDLPWMFLGGIIACAATGMVIGSALRQVIDGNRLKAGFGWFVLAVGVLVLTLEFLRR